MFVGNHQGGRLVVILKQLQAISWPEHIDGSCQAVGQEAGRRNDRNARSTRDRFAAPRIEDVGIAPAVDDEMLPRIPGGGNGLVF